MLRLFVTIIPIFLNCNVQNQSALKSVKRIRRLPTWDTQVRISQSKNALLPAHRILTEQSSLSVLSAMDNEADQSRGCKLKSPKSGNKSVIALRYFSNCIKIQNSQ